MRPASHLATEHLPLPSFVQIEPVGQCNLRCRMCPIQYRGDGSPKGPPAFMAFDDFTRLLDQFGQVEELHLQGMGEPLMHPRFFDMVEYAAARGIRVSTNTNMTFLTQKHAARCVDSGLHTLHMSLDGASAATFEAIRIRARFDKVLRNLRYLQDAKARRHSEFPQIRLVFVAMRRNLHELPELLHLAHAHGVMDVSVQHLCHDFGESTLPAQYRPMRDFVAQETLLDEDQSEVRAVFRAARETAAALGLTLRLPRTEIRLHPPGTPGPQRCDWPWRGAYLSYQGLAMPCCMISTPDRLNFGNMLETGVAAVWENEQYQDFRAQLASDEPPEICRNCSVYRGTF